MTVFLVMNAETKEVISKEECLGNAMELAMVLEEMGNKVKVEELTLETVG